MTLLFMDGFDVGDVALKWPVITQMVLSTTTRFGTGRSLQTSGVTGAYVKTYFAASSMIFVGVAYKAAALVDGTNPVISLCGDSGVTAHLGVGLKATGALTVSRGGTLLATSAIGVYDTGWVYIEISATIATTGGTCIVHANGVEVINFTGNTKNGGTNTTIDALNLSSWSTGGQASLFDDCYVCNDQGSANNDFLGDVRVQTLLPSGAGSSTQWTPSTGSNYDAVNDAPYVSTTYNYDPVSGHRDTYAMSDLIAGTGTVFGVQGVILAQKSDAGSASIKAAIVSGGTVYYDADQNLGTSLIASHAIREVDPATSAAWDPTNVNALEFGAEVV